MNVSIADDNEHKMGDFIPAPSPDYDEIVHQGMLSDAVRDLLDCLTDRERRVIELRFVHRKTLDQAGAEFNITRERARQIQKDAMAKLRERASAAQLYH